MGIQPKDMNSMKAASRSNRMYKISHVMQEPAGTVGDLSALATIITVFLGWMPEIAAAATFVWILLRIWQVIRIRGWWKRVDPPD